MHEKPDVVKTHLRNMIIMPEMIGSVPPLSPPSSVSSPPNLSSLPDGSAAPHPTSHFLPALPISLHTLPSVSLSSWGRLALSLPALPLFPLGRSPPYPTLLFQHGALPPAPDAHPFPSLSLSLSLTVSDAHPLPSSRWSECTTASRTSAWRSRPR